MSDEEKYAEDVAYARTFVALLQEQVAAAYPDPKHTLRDFHSKLHGLAKARFVVEPNLPDALGVGVFSQPCTFPAWVRLSNGQAKVLDDDEGDVRGLAIKLMGVTGPKLLDDETQTQDFLLVNAPTLGVRSVREFFDVHSAMSEGVFSLVAEVLNPRDPHVRCMFLLAKSMQECPNLMESNYWGVGAYALGNAAVKYKLRAHRQDDSSVPRRASPDYLRERLVSDLGNADQVFDFMVQLRTTPDAMPIEDASVIWDEDASPFVKVATLILPKQEVDTEQRRELSERMAFQPWHGIAEHRPLGGGQLARKIIYREMADFRRKRRGVEAYEPTPDDT